MKLKREMFDSFSNKELGGACFAPLIPLIRGKNIKIKEKLYQQLTLEQKALFMFYAFYNHAEKSLYEFYWWSYYYYAQPQIWSALKNALKFFKSKSMLQILTEMESIFIERNDPNSIESYRVSQQDLEQSPDLHSIQARHADFKKVSPDTLETIGQWIRQNPHLFIEDGE